MVKSKREVKSPRKKVLPIGRTVPRPHLAVNAPIPPANIKVVVRVRPLNDKEKGDNHRNVIKIVDGQMLVFDPEEESQPFFYHGVQQRGRDLLRRANKNMQFLFDKVFDSETCNNDVFKHSTYDLISSLMDGYNCSVFAYGATGAGKTHTMLGHNKQPGITFLTIDELFKRKNELALERDFELAVTYLEVYNENVQDLLNPGGSLHLREDGKYGVMVAGIQVKRIEQPSELFELLDKGNKNRTQHPTDANSESSRSHAVFQVYLRMNIKSSGQVRLAKLSMIDLAGSERGAATGCAGARFTEGANINKSLLALGNCINSLADGQRHVPYRDSKLTRLLKDSLGGNCRTVMIANISPSSITYEDTYNTLKYATRAKKIKSNIKKNVVNCENHIEQYVKRVDELTKEVERLQAAMKEKKCLCENNEPNLNLKINSEKMEKIKTFYAEYHGLQEQLFELQASEQISDVKRKLKEETNSRLSLFCADTPEREKGHKRMDNAVDRFQKTVDASQKKITTLLPRCEILKQNIENLLKEAPELQTCSDLESAKLSQLEAQYKAKLLQKIDEIKNNELNLRGQLLDKMASVLQPCYLLLRGHGHAPDDMIKEYKTLVRYLQGISNVTWDNLPDSGISSNTDSGEEEARASKRKHVDEVNVFESTFTLNSPPKPKYLSADQYSSKVLIPPPAKKIAKAISASPRVLKENRFPLRRPVVGTMGTAQRFPVGSKSLESSKLRKKLIPRSAASALQRQKV